MVHIEMRQDGPLEVVWTCEKRKMPGFELDIIQPVVDYINPCFSEERTTCIFWVTLRSLQSK